MFVEQRALSEAGWRVLGDALALLWGNSEPPPQPCRALRALQALESNRKIDFMHLKSNICRYSGPPARNLSTFKVKILFNIK